jgi:UbiD family decarboxylase
MPFTDLRSFLSAIESAGELHRVKVEVDPELEITEIAVRAVKENLPALLFEKVKGSSYPLAIGVLASEKRIELALGGHPQQIGEDLLQLLERLNPPSPRAILQALPQRRARPLYNAHHQVLAQRRRTFHHIWTGHHARPSQRPKEHGRVQDASV